MKGMRSRRLPSRRRPRLDRGRDRRASARRRFHGARPLAHGRAEAAQGVALAQAHDRGHVAVLRRRQLPDARRVRRAVVELRAHRRVRAVEHAAAPRKLGLHVVPRRDEHGRFQAEDNNVHALRWAQLVLMTDTCNGARCTKRWPTSRALQCFAAMPAAGGSRR